MGNYGGSGMGNYGGSFGGGAYGGYYGGSGMGAYGGSAYGGYYGGSVGGAYGGGYGGSLGYYGGSIGGYGGSDDSASTYTYGSLTYDSYTYQPLAIPPSPPFPPNPPYQPLGEFLEESLASLSALGFGGGSATYGTYAYDASFESSTSYESSEETGGAAPFPPPPPPASEVAAAVSAAAENLNAILSMQEEVTPEVAKEVTGFVSMLIGVQGASTSASASAAADSETGETDASTERAQQAAAESISNAIMQLAVGASATQDEVVLTSPNLNMKTEKRSAADIASKPLSVDSFGDDKPLEVNMPTTLFTGGLRRRLQAANFNESEPVLVVLYTTPTNIHSKPKKKGWGLKKGEQPKEVGESPAVSLSLVQAAGELKISGSESPINITVPFKPALSNGSAPCVGTPANKTERDACPSTVECRYWDKVEADWKTDGCETIPGDDGAFTCSCDRALSAMTPTRLYSLRTLLWIAFMLLIPCLCMPAGVHRLDRLHSI